MRATADETQYKLSAYASTYVVVLAWDTLTGEPPPETDLLGYAIERTEFDTEGTEVERYWMRGIKRFRNRDKDLARGTSVSLAEHPFQGFQWADYTAHESTRYRYRLVPIRGAVKYPKLDEAAAVALDITTEPEGEIVEPGSTRARHDIFFHRGVIGSQAYAREFGNREPDADNPRAQEMRWLSRGLFEALVGFIGLARDGMGLRAALYEFHYMPVANAFVQAIQAGADVQIVFDAASSSYKDINREMIRDSGLLEVAIERTVTEGIRHNKFIVLLDGETPVAVWTGSTNISHGGIFGHSNVGHIVWDKKIATLYLEYWERLSQNLTPTQIREPNREATPLPAGKPKSKSVTALFSARDDKTSNDTLQWYADRMVEAQELLCMTFAFNIDEIFQKVISRENDVLRYVVKDDPLGATESVGHDRDVIFAAGAYLGYGVLDNFLSERDNPLNRNDYIHTKYLLVDPLSNDPLVITGSANFSKSSQRINDENMLVIRDDTRVADIYFGEYMRVFDHHYARHIVKLLESEELSDPEAGFQKEATADWVPSHFNDNSYKSKRRRYFASPTP
jgi:phosphatidylserine/phosphatidylglycerophosphate/cardiolipin synthase-like enzyme